MSKCAIISDIHGNLEALQAVLKTCQTLGVQFFFCGGDTIGYGASPLECLETIKKLKAPTVAGNHDWAITGAIDSSHFTSDGKAAVAWTRGKLGLEHITSLNSLPLVLRNKLFLITHATLNEPILFHRLREVEDAQKTFDLMDRPLCFVGHTHIPIIITQQNGNIFFTDWTEVQINPKNKFIVNVGSVGQPRDANPLASFCVYDTDTRMIEIKRVAYNIAGAQKKIIEAGLPQDLASRLAVGK